jgi:integrase
MTRHRAHGEGTIFFNDKKGLWVAKVSLPNGKRRTKYNKRQSVVKEWLQGEREKVKKGTFVYDSKINVSGFMDYYMETYGKVKLRQTTFVSYSQVIRSHIKPELGGIKLSQLTPGQINQLIKKKLESGLSPRMVEYIHGILKRALNRAVKWQYITTNPALLSEPPSPNSPAPEVWNPLQVKTFLESLKGDRWTAIYYLACATGMRRGEILGLSMSSINLEAGYLKVVQSLQMIQGEGLKIVEPKTQKSRRMIMLPAYAVEALKEHLKRREELSKHPRWKESGLVFTTNIGTPIEPRNLNRHFVTKMEEAKLPHIRFHDLRHTVASILLEKNIHPKLVSELLGHSNVNLTLNTYSHIINPLNRLVADALDEVISTPKVDQTR